MALADMNVRIGAVITDFQKKMKQVQDSIGDTSDKLQATGDKMKSVGTGLTAGLTAPIGALGGVAMKSASDFESAQGRMQAQLGLSADEADKLGQIAREVWQGAFGTDINDVTDSIATVKQNIQGLNDSDLKTVTENAFTLRDAFGTDIKESTATASTMMKNFGIEATDAMDLMTVGFQKGGDYSGELMDTLREYSPQFSNMGHSAEDMMNILISGAEAGAWNLDKVGDAVKEFNIRAKDGSDSTAEGFETIGLKADEMAAAIAEGGDKGEQAFQATIAGLAAMEDPVERNKAGVALFGTQWEDLESDVVSAMGTTEDKLGTVEGATEKAGDAMYDTFGTKLQETMRNLGAALEPLGLVLLDMAQAILPPLTTWIQKIATWFQNLSPLGQTLTVVFGAIAAAIGPLLVVLGMVVGAIGNLLPLFTKLTPILNVVKTAFFALTGPVGLVIAIVSLLALLIFKYWDEIKAFTIATFQAIGDFLSATWEWIKTAASAAWEGIKTLFNATWQAIKQTAITVFTAIKDFLVTIWNGIVTFFTTIISSIVNFFVTGWNNLKTNTMNIFNAVKSFLTNLWSNIKTSISNIVSALIERVKSYWNNLKSNTTSIYNGIKDFIINLWNNIKSRMNSIIEGIKNAVKSKFAQLKAAVFSKMGETKQDIIDIWNQAKDFLAGIDLFQIGKDIIQGLIDGISNMAGSLWKKAGEIADGIKDKIQGALKIASPSKVMRFEVGQEVGAGLMVGMEDMERKINRSAQSMANAAIPDINTNRTSGERGGITQNITINSPQPLSPYETARRNKQAARQMAMEWGV